ncbi:hypothetical protein OWV82_022763 [Melia azedarach]|uniref:Uncharacterized protein n=1 Tax=Melia azedarach TaxID=155640 RepID=A0ACC1WU87_MELAZ|nr:hypothetical protein OWV82_022763 [Melia azedarach]
MRNPCLPWKGEFFVLWLPIPLLWHHHQQQLPAGELRRMRIQLPSTAMRKMASSSQLAGAGDRQQPAQTLFI